MEAVALLAFAAFGSEDERRRFVRWLEARAAVYWKLEHAPALPEDLTLRSVWDTRGDSAVEYMGSGVAAVLSGAWRHAPMATSV